MLYAALFLLLAARARRKPTASGVGMSQTAQDTLYQFLMEHEGGLSNADIDKELERAPCNVVIKGKKMDPPPHTSRGVIWKTFKSLAPKIGYDPSCKNFAAMSQDPPMGPWKDIVKYYQNRGLSYSKNPIISTYMGLWYWGSWRQEIISPADVVQAISSTSNTKLQLRRLVDLRKEYFTEVARLNPAKKPALKNWLGRAEDFYETFSPFV